MVTRIGSSYALVAHRSMPRYEPTYHVTYPCLQVRPYGIIVYDRTEYLTSRPKKHHSNAHRLTTAYSGTVTPYAKKKLKRAIQLMVASAKEKEAPNWKAGKTFKFKVNFITLTLPSRQLTVTDKQIKTQVLDPFIKRLKRKFQLGSYVWRAERQINGNIHFHMITDTWIHHEKIRNDWNSCLSRFHFIDEFEKKHGHRNPNSTDVHAVWKIKNLTNYFVKYMTKGEQTAETLMNIPYARRKWHEKIIVKESNKFKRVLSRAETTIEGKIWDCSTNLKTKKNCETLLEGDQLQLWHKLTEDPTVQIKSDSNFSIAFLNPQQFKKYIKGTLLNLWNEYLATIRAATEPPVPASQ